VDTVVSVPLGSALAAVVSSATICRDVEHTPPGAAELRPTYPQQQTIGNGVAVAVGVPDAVTEPVAVMLPVMDAVEETLAVTLAVVIGLWIVHKWLDSRKSKKRPKRASVQWLRVFGTSRPHAAGAARLG
jgi:hypothetical protein